MFIRRATGSDSYEVYSKSVSRGEYLGTIHRSRISYSSLATGDKQVVYRYFAYTPDYYIVANIANSAIAFKSVSEASLALASVVRKGD